MAYFTIEQWVALSVLAGIGILTILRVLAHRFEHERALHDLRVQARTLRHDYNARLAAMKSGAAEDPIEVDVIDTIEPEAVPMQAAA